MNDIKQKIRKLLAMAATGSGASEDEAATAMKMAMALMTRHGIEQDQLGGELPKAVFGQRGRTRDQKKGQRVNAAMIPHHVSLASAAATLYGCKALFYDRGRNGFVFVGRPDNIDAAETTLFWLIQQVEELFKEAKKIKLEENEFIARTDEFRITFKEACSNRVWHRAIDLVKNPALIAQATGKNELVVKDYFEKLDAEAVQAMGKVKPMRASKSKYGYGSIAGWKAGDKVKLRREIGEMSQ